jgi:hypothetical protein
VVVVRDKERGRGKRQVPDKEMADSPVHRVVVALRVAAADLVLQPGLLRLSDPRLPKFFRSTRWR